MLNSDTLTAALRGANLSRLAERCGLDRKTLQRIRDGENSPSLRNAEAIARAMRAMAIEQGLSDPFPGVVLPDIGSPPPLAPAQVGQHDAGGGPGPGATDEPAAARPGGPAAAEDSAAVKEAA